MSVQLLPLAFAHQHRFPLKKLYSQGKKLKETLPISNDNFDLDYSYDSLLFEVKLKKPHDDNYNKFIEWLTSEYAELSPEQFNFTLEE